MAEPDFQVAIRKIIEKYQQHLSRFEEFREKNRQAAQKAWNMQMACHLKGNSECVHEYNQLYLQHHRVSREKLAHRTKCYDRCNEEFGNFDEKKKPDSMKDVNDMQSYIDCLRPCVETQITYTKKEIDVMDRTITVLNRFIKN
jgi:ribosomal protein L19E